MDIQILNNCKNEKVCTWKSKTFVIYIPMYNVINSFHLTFAEKPV